MWILCGNSNTSFIHTSHDNPRCLTDSPLFFDSDGDHLTGQLSTANESKTV